ncbi:MAG TPA: NYN domain-containing protein [Vicinamibacterales bacterium]|nr:NYN domain-containing protein [Vicinamibacterales bacterium]
MPHQDRLNIAVFIDFDNIEIGVKTTLGQPFDVGVILDAIKERGEVVTKIAYADWTRSGEYSRSLTQHAIRLVQRNMTPGGDKNGADINLALDALEMAFTHPHINAYVIVGGDSDFLSLVEKLKQYDKKVFVVGGRAFTSVILQRNCHEFIAYENLHGVRKAVIKTGRPMPAAAASAPVAQAFPVVKRALKILADREVTPQTGLLKSTLLQLDSTFSERNYGASSFLDFVEKLANTGFVHLKTSGRSVMVELNPSFDDGEKTRAALPESEMTDIAAATTVLPAGEAVAPAQLSGAAPFASSGVTPFAPSGVAQAFRPAGEHGSRPGGDQDRSAEPIGPPAGDQADGVRHVAGILAAATTARWPMYLRNVKQILRAADNGFDERRYGFGGLMDLLRACQRENLIRLERDRRGGLRVFQGSALQRQPAPVATTPMQPTDVFESQPIEISATQAASAQDAADADMMDSEPMPTVDPTAELLGRAKARRPRSRLAATPVVPEPEPSPTRARKPARSTAGGSRAKSTTTTRSRSTGRGKKASAADSNDDFGNR